MAHARMAHSIEISVPRDTDKRPEARPGQYLWPKDWPQLARLVSIGKSLSMTGDGRSSCFANHLAMR